MQFPLGIITFITDIKFQLSFLQITSSLLQCLSQLLVFFTFYHHRKYRNTGNTVQIRHWKIRYLRQPFSISLWNNLSTFSCLNIPTFSKNGMLIDVTHKLGYHSSNLVRKKKQKQKTPRKQTNKNPKTKPTGFPVFIYGFLCPCFPQWKYPRSSAPSICSPDNHWNGKAYFKLFLRASKHYAQLYSREAHSLPNPSHQGKPQTQQFGCDHVRIQGFTRPSPKLRCNL